MAGWLDFFGKKQVSQPYAYNLECTVHPLRIASRGGDYAQLTIGLENSTDQELLTSLIIQLPKALGLDATGLQHEKETRLGLMKPGEKKVFVFNVYASRAGPGLYPVNIYAASHYRDYGHVINETKKSLELRVV